MRIFINNYEVNLIDEPPYSRNSTDNIRTYDSELCRNDKYEHVSAYGVIVGDVESPDSSVVLLGVGGATGIHTDSIAHFQDECFLAVGDAVFALSIPSLELRWCHKVDLATCFGVYWHQNENCLITWGEIEVCRFTKDGEKSWSVSGADTFTESFELNQNHIVLTDFNNDKYHINIKTGDIV